MEDVVKIDPHGRVLLPKAIRAKFNLIPGTPVKEIEQDDEIILKVSKPKFTLGEILKHPIKFDPSQSLAFDIANLNEEDFQE
ncbi:MAG TPA: AbrB/MazE/SpoVT family DNA-binding domain-containing protein [Candidatus Lokiarchaeia archaeon]|nr:AbrB/MazE/SpoVT family DNA-binding domain-containing protein [Candidatus Lokiarchaeia archaeon]